MTQPVICLLLDSTALVRYADWNVDVMEVLQELYDDPNAAVGVPVVSLIEARAVVQGRDLARLDALVRLPEVVVLDVIAEDWQELSFWRSTTGDSETAAAALAAVQFGAPLLTTKAGRYGNGQYLPVIELS
ncbi:hypothetical protein [Melissospora conviva]|uniref:hypothetical protein n=1 Tax=Melissospora conviva TaxID=3388432 RepID=UPI003C1D75A3